MKSGPGVDGLFAFVAGAMMAAGAFGFCTDDLSYDPAVREYWAFDPAKNAVTVECVDGAGGVLTVAADGSMTFAKTNDAGTVYLRATNVTGIPPKTNLRFSVLCSCSNAVPLESRLDLVGEVKGKIVETNPYLILRGASTAIDKQRMLVNKTMTKVAYLSGSKTPMTPVVRISGAAATVTLRDWKARDLKDAKARFDKTRRKAKFPPPVQVSEEDFVQMLEQDVEHTARLEVRDGRAVLLVDGQPSAPMLSLVKGEQSNFFGAGLHAAGVPIVGIPVSLVKDGGWSSAGFDAVRAADSVMARMRTVPKALFLLSFRLTAYDEMAREYPEEAWIDEKGLKVGKNPQHGGYAASLKPEVAVNPKTILWMSNLSPVWRQKVKDILTETVAELKRRGAMKRVVAFHLAGYHDGQFATARLDYSSCAKAGYPKWLEAEKDNPGPKTYLAYLKRAPFAMQEDVMRHLKKLAGKDVIGAKWCMSAFGEGLASTYDITPLTRSDAIDVEIPQPSYAMREGGYPLGVRLPTNSLGRHGKMLMYEFDLRTPAESESPTEFREFGLSRAETYPDFIDQHRKLAGIQFAHDSGFWYYDMKCGWFEPPEIRADIAGVAQVGRRLAARKPTAWKPTVAFLVDEDGLLARGGWIDGSKDPFRPGDISTGSLDVLAASGVPFDPYLVNDFVLDETLATSYKVVFTYGVDWSAPDRQPLKAKLDAAGVVVQATGTQTPRDFRAVVAKAGGYIPARHGLQVDMNGDFASVHCLVPGHYDFTLPGGKVVPMDLRTGETRWLDREGKFIYE